MNYFDDISFLNAGIHPGCRAVVDHSFPGSWSVEFILSGKMFYGVDGGAQSIIDQPSVFWHSPDHSYQYGAVDRSGWDHHWVQFKGPRGCRLIENGFDNFSDNGIIQVKNPQAFANLFHSLVPLVQAGFPRNQVRSVTLLERIYIMLLNEQYCSSVQSYSSHIDDLARRLENSPMQSYDFKKEAKRSGLSYSRFRTIFRQQLGFSPHDYLLRCRMRYSARLLENPGNTVKNVAYECGFNDPAQFSRLFKKKIGVSPQSYQQSIPGYFDAMQKKN